MPRDLGTYADQQRLRNNNSWKPWISNLEKLALADI